VGKGKGRKAERGGRELLRAAEGKLEARGRVRGEDKIYFLNPWLREPQKRELHKKKNCHCRGQRQW